MTYQVLSPAPEGTEHDAPRRPWPVAAAMLPFPGRTPDGTPVQDAGPAHWLGCLREVAALGFTEVDLTDSWLRPGDLSAGGVSQLAGALAEAGLRAEAISVIRHSVIDPVDGDVNLAYSHRSIDVAAQLGCSTVSVGLHRPLTERQRQVLWFWTVDGPKDDPDPATWELAVGRLRELARHAEQAGVLLSLEMYEDTLLGTADSAVRLVKDIDHPSVGLNPDIGNLIRLQRPVEHWQDMLAKCLPHTNYWHVKNYVRMEDPGTGTVLTAPSPLDGGLINYRAAVRDAIAAGFTGAFCVEHYGGDGLGASAASMRYLRTLLSPTP